jgi:Heterokaryon incompatibility protein (HET)
VRKHPSTLASMENMAQDYRGQGRGNGPEELFAQQKVCAGGHSEEEKCTNPPLKSTILDQEKLETRLLTLFSGEFQDTIRCNLNPVSLRANPSYIALSYCWGESDTRGEIEINGQKTCVRESVAIALKYLRRSRGDMMVWADAISINQEDADEKEYQVRMMGSIYTNGRA